MIIWHHTDVFIAVVVVILTDSGGPFCIVVENFIFES